jgi:nitrilase
MSAEMPKLRRERASSSLKAIPRGKFDFDAVGHYAGPDVFKLMVNEQPMAAVMSKTK